MTRIAKEAGASPFQDGIRELVGAQLSSFTVVMDYFQFEFQSEHRLGRLNVYNALAIVGAGYTLRKGDAGYFDAICGLVRSRVTASGHEPSKRLWLEFEGGLRLEVSLLEKDFRGPEAAEWNPADRSRGSVIWQYGD